MYEESGEKAIYIEKVMEYIRRTVADMQMLMEKADQICMEPDGPYMYGDMLEADQKVLRKLFAAKSYEEMYEALKGHLIMPEESRDLRKYITTF